MIAVSLRLPFVAVLTVSQMAALAQSDGEHLDFDYQAQVKRIRAGDPKVDFDRLRMAFAGMDDTGLSDVDASEKIQAIRDAMSEGDFTRGLELVDEILASNPVYPDAYLYARVCHERLGHRDKAEAYQAILQGLFYSITDEQNCMDRKHPCPVIEVYEEYFVIRAMGLRPDSQSLGTCADVPCDIMSVVDPKTEQSYDLYFDITLPQEQMMKAISRE